MMNIQEIMQILPHRAPFLLIDRVMSLESGKSIVAVKNVTINEYFFSGHFPTEPVMPGVLIIEALAQAGALCVLSLDENKGKIGYLAAVDNAKFREKVVPGDVLRLEMHITKLKGVAGIGNGIAYVENKKVCEAKLTFMLGKR